ncbi:hypothetical protein MAR_018130 [Mya arenaria]|uniref:Uncharacterized protein n=1 Tax=Mya arenaria TaxID=6604 RepID=A0ABY7EH29_MYAAR|nr:hypothetical protein MAR_018130 [Mya arenaria]
MVTGNQINGARDQINGAGNQINGAGNQINGAGNQINGARDQINGAGNQINGARDQINGAGNQINGAGNQINGAGNQIYGARDQINGAGNQINGAGNQINGARDQINGAGNQINGAGNQINGAGNQINGARDQINGAGNQINGAGNQINGAGNQINGAGNQINGSPERGMKASGRGGEKSAFIRNGNIGKPVENTKQVTADAPPAQSDLHVDPEPVICLKPVSMLSKIRENHLARRRDFTRQTKMPQLSELTEKETAADNNNHPSKKTVLVEIADDVLRPPMPNSDSEIMPSIPDEFLQKLGLIPDGKRINS